MEEEEKNNNQEPDNFTEDIEKLLKDLDEVKLAPDEAAEKNENIIPEEISKKELKSLEQESGRHLDGNVVINISDDRMKVTASFYHPSGDGKPIDIDLVEEKLFQNDVNSGIDWQLIKDTIFRCNIERVHIQNVVIARGEDPVPEIPEHLVLEESLQKKQESDLSTQKIDFREYSPFTIVKKGDILAKKVPLRPGKMGTDVHGLSIPYKKEKVQQLLPGENTRWQEDSVVAATYGRLIIEKETFWVNEVLEITSDVDYSTGNVVFPGDIIIHGDLKEQFKVESEGSIYGKKTFDASNVVCAKDLVVEQGIIGRKEGIIKVGGKINTRFIENCYVEAGDDIFVKTCIMNSIVRTRGKIEMGERGTIIGGKIIAQKGVYAVQIGTSSGTRTEIQCGVDYTIEQKIQWIKENTIKLTLKLQEVEKQIASNNPQKEKLIQLKEKLKEKLQQLNEYTISLMDKLDKSEEAEVEVRGIVHPGAIITICRIPLEINQEMKKIRFALDKTKGQILASKL